MGGSHDEGRVGQDTLSDIIASLTTVRAGRFRDVSKLGARDGGSPCRMSIIRNGNDALSNLRKGCVALSI